MTYSIYTYLRLTRWSKKSYSKGIYACYEYLSKHPHTPDWYRSRSSCRYAPQIARVARSHPDMTTARSDLVRDAASDAAAAVYGTLTGGFCGCMVATCPTRPVSFSSTDHDTPKDSPGCVDHHRCDAQLSLWNALQQLPHCIHTRIVLTPP